MHVTPTMPLGPTFVGCLPNAGLSASSFIQAQVFGARVASAIPVVNSAGAVIGPASSTDNAITRWDGTTGTVIQNSAAFLDDSGRVLTGSATAQALLGITGSIQVLGTTDDTSAFTVARWSNDTAASNWVLGKARGATIGTNTIVANGDFLGSFSFAGANGTTFVSAANIAGVVDGTPGASNDMPGKLIFRTTPDGSGTLSTRMEIRNDGHILVNTATNTASLGNIQIGTTSDTTDVAGILFGADTQLYRGAANILVAPDMISARNTAGTPYTDGTSAASLVGTTNNYALSLCESTQSANNRKAELVWGAGNLDLRFINDAYNAVANIMRVTGGQSTGVTLITFPVAVATVFGHTASNANAGVLQVKAGTQTTNIAGVGGTTYVNTTQTGNTAATETDAFSHSIAANTLTTNGASLEFYAAGTFATSASVDKRVKVVFGGTTLFDSGALAVTVAADWSVRGSVIRTGAATQKANVVFTSSDAALRASSDYTTPAETLSGAVTMKLTVNGTNANDTVAELYKEQWAAAA